jgi:hypothetical protein
MSPDGAQAGRGAGDLARRWPRQRHARGLGDASVRSLSAIKKPGRLLRRLV